MSSPSRLPAGIYPPLVTTFRGETFDEDAYRRQIERLHPTSLAGYVVLGSNGESAYLDDDEAVRVLEVAAEARDPGKAFLAGTGRESTRRTIALSRRAARAGADAVMVVAPSYYRSQMTEAALEAHYRAIADAAEVPVVLYYVPKFSPVTFSARLILSLADHPNVVGIKDTSGDMILLAEVLARRPEGFRVWIGSASILLAGLALGGDGGVLALANVLPDECVRLWQLVSEGRLEEARSLQARFLPINQAITARFGIAGLKFALARVAGLPVDVRRPLMPLRQEEEEELLRILRAGGVDVG